MDNSFQMVDIYHWIEDRIERFGHHFHSWAKGYTTDKEFAGEASELISSLTELLRAFEDVGVYRRLKEKQDKVDLPTPF